MIAISALVTRLVILVATLRPGYKTMRILLPDVAAF